MKRFVVIVFALSNAQDESRNVFSLELDLEREMAFDEISSSGSTKAEKQK